MADEIDLRDKLLSVAGSLAADFGASADRAEELIFTSADRLLAVASVTDFVPILAERDARRAIRTGGAGPVTVRLPALRPDPVTVEAVPVETAPLEAVPVEAVPVESPTVEGPAVAEPAAAPPLVALPDGRLTDLRGDVERARQRLAEWQADLTGR